MAESSPMLLPVSKHDIMEAAGPTEKIASVAGKEEDTPASSEPKASPTLTTAEQTKILPLLIVLGASVQLLRYAIFQPNDSPWEFERALHLLLGVSITGLSYMLLRLLKCQETTAFLASCLILLESGTLTRSQYALLDSPIVLFVASFLCLYLPIHTYRHAWVVPVLASVCLGAGLYTDWQAILSILALVLRIPFQFCVEERGSSTKHRSLALISRTVCFVFAPLSIFVLFSGVHYQLSQSLGPVPSINGTTNSHVSLGSEVTVRHFYTPRGYLYSYIHAYPSGSQQQLVSLYDSRNDSMHWRVERPSTDNFVTAFDTPDWQVAVTDTMRIRFQHIPSERRLHSHQVPAPVVEDPTHQEVTAYGVQGFMGDANDDWFVELAYADMRDDEAYLHLGNQHLPLRTQKSLFRLKHVITGCYLSSNGTQLPDWGFGGQEVTCHRREGGTTTDSLWIIDESSHSKSPSATERVTGYAPTPMQRLWDIQRLIWATNAGKVDRQLVDYRQHFWVNTPTDLPSFPFAWQLAILAVIIYPLLRLYNQGRSNVNVEHPPSVIQGYDSTYALLLAGWIIHYFPFKFVDSTSSAYPLFPALYLSILLLAVVFDYATLGLRPRARLQVVVFTVALIIGNFVYLVASVVRLELWSAHVRAFKLV